MDVRVVTYQALLWDEGRKLRHPERQLHGIFSQEILAILVIEAHTGDIPRSLTENLLWSVHRFKRLHFVTEHKN
jgi:hypothetical protein